MILAGLRCTVLPLRWEARAGPGTIRTAEGDLMADDDAFLDDELFPDDADVPTEAADTPRWTVLIVDDEPDIHDVTKLALRDVRFMGRGLRFLSAHSADEAVGLLDEHDDVAIILLDVVMESDHAGLEFVRWLRDERGNSDIRIILRTGQPGQAPEREVLLAYDINDYKSKSELTANGLFGAVITALRGREELLENAHLREEMVDIMAARGRAEAALVDMLPIPVVQIDPLGQIVGANQPFATLAGAAEPGSLIGRVAGEVLADDLAAALGVEEADVSGHRRTLAGRDYDIHRRRFQAAGEAAQGAVICLMPAVGG